MNKKILIILLIISIFISCSPSPKKSPQEIYKETAKYIIIDNGPYNAWNGGPQWIYYCDSYLYEDEHYILKNINGEIIADFTKSNNHRVEIKRNN